MALQAASAAWQTPCQPTHLLAPQCSPALPSAPCPPDGPVHFGHQLVLQCNVGEVDELVGGVACSASARGRRAGGPWMKGKGSRERGKRTGAGSQAATAAAESSQVYRLQWPCIIPPCPHQLACNSTLNASMHASRPPPAPPALPSMPSGISSVHRSSPMSPISPSSMRSPQAS